MKSSSYKLPVSGKKSSLGVYLTDDILSYVELQATRDGIHIVRFGEASIVVDGGVERYHAAIEKALVTLKRKASGTKVHVALSDSIATFFEIAIKETDPFLLKKILHAEIERAAPQTGSKLLIQSEVLFTDRNTTRVAVAVVPEHTIRATAALFKHAGFTPSRVGLATESVALLLAPTGAKFFLHIDETETVISIVLNGSLVLEGRVAGGTNQFIESIAEKFGADREEIKEALLFEGIQGNTALLSALRMPLRKITDEIEKMFLYWHIDCKKEKECRLTEVVFFGLGATIPGLASYIQKTLSLPVVVPEILSGIPLASAHVPEMTRTETLTHLPALALALSEFRVSN